MADSLMDESALAATDGGTSKMSIQRIRPFIESLDLI
jgi:hypothetical protein